MKNTIKKALALLCALSMIFSIMIVTKASGVQLTVSTVNITQGTGTESVSIPINISGNTGILGMTLKVTYAEGLELTEVTGGTALGTLMFTKPGNYSANPVSLVWDGLDGADSTDGTVATLKFNVPKTEANTYEISVVAEGVVDNDINTVDMSITNGCIKVDEKPKENITGVTFSDKTVVYNGQEWEIAVSGTLPDGATVNYTNNKGTDVGTYNATAIVTAGGYNDLELDATLVIEPKELTVTGLSAQNKTYDGTTAAIVEGGNLNGAISGDDVSVDIPQSGTFASKDAGKNIAVEIEDIILSGSDKANYTLLQPAGLKATISKALITVNADDKFVVRGGIIPELTYTITSGELFENDEITGELSTNANTSSVRDYTITQGTLSAGNNYDMTFNKGTLSVIDKTPQNISVSEISSKTYGDASFTVTVTPDTESRLSDFTYESSNTDVAEIASDGTVTIKAAGETTITVKQSGNDEYAATEVSQAVTVNKKIVTLTFMDLDEKTAVLEGVITEDSAVELDFNKINIDITGTVDETTSSVNVTNFVLKGEKSENYQLLTESLESTISTDNIIDVTTVAENGTVIGAGSYIKGRNITITAVPNSRFKFAGWYEGDELVSSQAEYSFVTDSDVELTAMFKKKSSGGGGSSVTYYTINFVTNGAGNNFTQRIPENKTVATPTTPVKKGYVFTGWYNDANLTQKYDFAEKVTASTTLYAGWKDEDLSKTQIVLTIGKREVIVFGEESANDVAPKIVNDRTMLPARFVAENLGATVEWDGELRLVTITKDSTVIKIYINSNKAYVNGSEAILDSEAFIENDRTYTPLRFVAENLGAKVDWNEKTQEVTITKQ